MCCLLTYMVPTLSHSLIFSHLQLKTKLNPTKKYQKKKQKTKINPKTKQKIELAGAPRRPPPGPSAAAPLFKQKSWSPDAYRDDTWQRRKSYARKARRSKSVTEEDLDELKACFELGFGFDSPEVDPKLSDTLPALGLYHAVNRQYYDSVSKSCSSLSVTSSAASECGSPTSPHTIFSPGDNPQTVKTRLRQWAQVVACSVRQSYSS